MPTVSPILLCFPVSGLSGVPGTKKRQNMAGNRKQQLALPSGCDTEQTWRHSMHYVSRFQSRLRSEKSHGEGVPEGKMGSNDRPQTPW
jgi:hypothetical protein